MNRFQQQLLKKVNRTNTPSISMQLRLLAFLMVLVFTMVSGIVVILLVTGVFTAGLKETREMLGSELDRASYSISEQYGHLALQAVEFSEELSKQLEWELNQNNISITQLSKHPDLLEEVILGAYELTYFSLQKSNCSGAFLILNSTVNPELENAEYSRAGLYIKNMEPNIISSSAPNLTILRGSSSIGRKNSVNLHTQWSMEFNIQDALYYTVPQRTAVLYSDLPLSKLYYWSGPLTLPNTSEEVMLCSVPLIDSNQNIYGVCGLEISSMLFKLSHMPINQTYSRMFCMLSQEKEGSIDTIKSMLAGGYSVKNVTREATYLHRNQGVNSFNTYGIDKDPNFVGFDKATQLYPKDSPFIDEAWVTSVLIPKEDIVDSITRLNLILVFLLCLLVAVGIFISVVFSNKYLKPISDGFEILKSSEPGSAPKTNVQEIDELIQYLSLYKEEINRKREQEKLKLQVLEEFVERTNALTPAERTVFNLYVQGLSNTEIAQQLYLSINTIKTHNKRIYSKLNVASREELLLYINMLKEVGHFSE